MKKLVRKLIVLYLALIVVLVANVFIKSQENTQEKVVQTQSKLGSLRIVILPLLDENSMPIAGEDEPVYRVFIQKDSILKEIPFKSGGIYESAVPEGVYGVVLKTMDGEIIPYQRANFYVSLIQPTVIDIPFFEGMEVCSKTGYILSGRTLSFSEASQQEKSETFDPKYDTISVNSTFNSVFKYCKKDVNNKLNIYRYARFTYKAITVDADKVVFDYKKLIVKFIGNRDNPVLVENDGKFFKKDNIEFDLKSGRFKNSK